MQDGQNPRNCWTFKIPTQPKVVHRHYAHIIRNPVGRLCRRKSSNLFTSASSSQATYRLRRAFSFYLITKLIARSFRCSSLPNQTRFTGLRFEAAATRRFCPVTGELSILTVPSTSEQSRPCSDVFLCLGREGVVRPLPRPPFHLRPCRARLAVGRPRGQIGRPCAGLPPRLWRTANTAERSPVKGQSVQNPTFFCPV